MEALALHIDTTDSSNDKCLSVDKPEMTVDRDPTVYRELLEKKLRWLALKLEFTISKNFLISFVGFVEEFYDTVSSPIVPARLISRKICALFSCTKVDRIASCVHKTVHQTRSHGEFCARPR